MMMMTGGCAVECSSCLDVNSTVMRASSHACQATTHCHPSLTDPQHQQHQQQQQQSARLVDRKTIPGTGHSTL